MPPSPKLPSLTCAAKDNLVRALRQNQRAKVWWLRRRDSRAVMMVRLPVLRIRLVIEALAVGWRIELPALRSRKRRVA